MAQISRRHFITAAGIAANSKSPEEARQLIKYLSSAAVAPTIAKTGLEPITAKPE